MGVPGECATKNALTAEKWKSSLTAVVHARMVDEREGKGREKCNEGCAENKR